MKFSIEVLKENRRIKKGCQRVLEVSASKRASSRATSCSGGHFGTALFALVIAEHMR